MIMKMIMVLTALYWKWALISEPMLFLWGAIPDCRTPPIVFVPPSVPFPYPARLCISAVPRSYPSAAVPCSYSVPPPAAMQGHKRSVQRCKHRPDPGAVMCLVRACSCKPSQSTVPPTLGWELKKFTKSSSRWTIQPENPNRMQRMKGIKVNGPPTQILGKFFGIRFFDALFQNFAANCEPLSPPVPQLTSEGS